MTGNDLVYESLAHFIGVIGLIAMGLMAIGWLIGHAQDLLARRAQTAGSGHKFPEGRSLGSGCLPGGHHHVRCYRSELVDWQAQGDRAVPLRKVPPLPGPRSERHRPGPGRDGRSAAAPGAGGAPWVTLRSARIAAVR